MKNKTIAIIGAGYAGLSTANIFKQYGFEVHVFEKDKEVGGVWASSRRYPGLTTQNPKDTYCLSELKMPKNYPEWPEGKQVQEYMESYVDYVKIRDNISFNKECTSTTQNADFSWNVTIKDLKTNKKTESKFDYLMICNGIFCKPNIPDFKGVQEFKDAGGQIFHTSQFNDKQWAKDKNLVVVGFGKSSCDVATSVESLAKSTSVVARSIIWKIPKKFFGLLNMKFILLTRLGENLFAYIRRSGMAKFLHSFPGKAIRSFLLGSVQSVVSTQLKLKKANLHPGNSLDTIARANVSLASDDFFNKVVDGRIKMHKGTQIEQLSAKQATLANGETIDADVIVCGTGWKQEVPFMDKKIMDNILDSNGDFQLYRNQLPIGIKNLGFNGYNSSFYSQLSSEIGALWLIEALTKGFELPSEEEQLAHTTKQLAWSKERSNGKNSKGTNIIPFTMNHIDELTSDIGVDVSAMNKFMQWQVPTKPSSYAKVISKCLSKFNHSRKEIFFTK